jgi:glucuronate isomerase
MGLQFHDLLPLDSQNRTSRSEVAAEIYAAIGARPIVSPHTHVPVELFADSEVRFGTPADFFIIPDHYVLRMLYSCGIPMEQLGIAPIGETSGVDHRSIWRLFAEHFFIFDATPTGLWIRSQLRTLFDVEEPLTSANADSIYDRILQKLADMSPRDMYDMCGIEVLSTTDNASGSLQAHLDLRDSNWPGRVVPTFRPDDVTSLENPLWTEAIEGLAHETDVDILDYSSYIDALVLRRTQFIDAGATAADHGTAAPETSELSQSEAAALFDRALRGDLAGGDSAAFSAHMLCQMAEMSCSDGLVMQLHTGVFRDHNAWHRAKYGEALGGDIPVRTEFTNSLRNLLGRFGNSDRLTLIVFTLDEATYARELAPLAGHYPAMRLGPPWWFNDTPNGIHRYLNAVVETAGIQNLVGFNDDARGFGSIPVRHDVWRRSCARWLAAQVADGMVDVDAAHRIAIDLSDGLARSTYFGKEHDDSK